MAFIRTLCCIFAFLIILLVSPTSSSFPSIIQVYPEKESFLLNDGGSAGRRGVDLYCESWKFTVETNDAGSWGPIPERCLDFVKEYVTGARYTSDSEAVADSAVAYAKSVRVSGDGKDAWVFDIDETLLSNVPYYAAHGFGVKSSVANRLPRSTVVSEHVTSTTMSFSKFNLEKFDGKISFTAWKTYMYGVLVQSDLKKALAGKAKKPANMSDEE